MNQFPHIPVAIAVEAVDFLLPETAYLRCAVEIAVEVVRPGMIRAA